MILHSLGLKYGTDKATTHFYLDNYERYFHPFREEEFSLLEIGVGSGGSIRTWREYFPKAKVYGIDNNPTCAGEGIFIGDQTDYNFLTEVVSQTGPLSIVIEDGSHVGQDMITTFKFFFKKILSGGYYVLEDTHCIYSDHYRGSADPFGFFTGLVRDVDVTGRGMCGNAEFAINHGMTDPPVPEYSRELKAIHFHTSLYFFERR